ncbi:class I SAM-dependent methyltransferase [Burkholderia glumae]|uniref:class I SAM-dependent methyltransferase n=1 Tax=Burkholderia glumae TaxID=337 RepID=UPI0009B71E53|nr:class I SAM-dependent methyltransferase [Burkholderia glumae]
MRNSINPLEASGRRLALFQKFLHPSTNSLLQSSAIKVGDSVVDIGCGDGAVTLILSRLVGPMGRIFAIDRDKAKLRQLEERAAKEGFNNINVICCDAFESLGFVGMADVVYSRFFYMHLIDHSTLLKKIHDAAPCGCKLIAEEPIIDATFEQPDGGLWNGAIDNYIQHCRVRDINPNYGRNVINDLRRSGWVIQSAAQIQAIIDPETAARYIEFSLCSAKETYLNSGVLTDVQHAKLLDDLYKVDLSKIDYCGFHAVMQVVANKC